MQAFVRLVEAGSFSAAATELRVKQSTVSKWVAALEEEFGAQLVERTTRSQRVTEPGQRFYERARELLAAYEEAASELQERAPEPRGLLRVSVPTVFGRLFIVPHVARFMRRYLEVEVELVFSDRYVNLVEEGIDVAIRVGLPADSTFRARKLGETRRHLVASPGYLKQHPAPRAPKDLKEHSCLLHTGLRIGDIWSFQRAGKAFQAPVRGRFAANNSEAVMVMARAGIGIALLAQWLVEEDLRSGRLVSLLPDYAPPPAPVQAILPPGKYVHPRVRAFIDFLADAAFSQPPFVERR
jgi:DNA-binding transcriptional LysR family regulator